MPEDNLSAQLRAFRTHVRRTLNSLYDPANLRRTSLLDILSIREGGDRVFTTREVIQKAIQAIKPGRATPGNPTTRQVYQILNYRYLEQMGQKEVAAELAISLRQLQRLEVVALDTLCAYLLEEYNIRLQDLNIFQDTTEDKLAPADGIPSPLSQELEWVKQSGGAETAELSQFLEQVIETTTPLLMSRKISASIAPIQGEIFITGNLMALRQGFINILTALSSTLPSCALILTAWVENNMAMIRIHYQSETDLQVRVTAEEERILLAQELFQIAGGEIAYQFQEDSGQQFIISIPSRKSLSVLVVDDNADALSLINAYLSEMGSIFHGVTDPARVLSTAETIQPDIILLDVMLPGIDGWQILGRLKHSPATEHIPVIISTILPQSELALSLGAQGFLRKPFTQPELIDQILSLTQSGQEFE